MPIKRNDAGAMPSIRRQRIKSMMILSQHKSLIKLTASAMAKGAFVASWLGSFWAVMSIDTYVWRSLIVMAPLLGYVVLYWVIREARR